MMTCNILYAKIHPNASVTVFNQSCTYIFSALQKKCGLKPSAWTNQWSKAVFSKHWWWYQPGGGRKQGSWKTLSVYSLSLSPLSLPLSVFISPLPSLCLYFSLTPLSQSFI